MSIFPIAPAESRFLWYLIPLSGLLLGIVIVMMISMRGAHSTRFEIVSSGLRLSGDMYSRTIPWQRLQVDGARRVDFTADQQLTPGWRHAGTALPGYRAGWFRLKNGERALLYLTDRSKAVYVPTSAGFSVLLSPADPDRFLTALRSFRVP